MDVSSLKRDAASVMKAIQETDGSYISKKDMKVYAPTRYITKGLGEVGATTRIFGFFAVVVDDVYMVVNANALMVSDPDSTTVVDIDGVDYYEYSYSAGSKLVANRDLVMVDTIVYYIFDMFIGRAKIPWFANIKDIAKLFITAKKYAGASIYDSNVVVEMILSQLVRVRSDKSKFYRLTGKSVNDPNPNDYDIVPLRSPLYGSTNTTSALIGANYETSLTTAINNPSETVEPLEKLLIN